MVISFETKRYPSFKKCIFGALSGEGFEYKYEREYAKVDRSEATSSGELEENFASYLAT